MEDLMFYRYEFKSIYLAVCAFIHASGLDMRGINRFSSNVDRAQRERDESSDEYTITDISNALWETDDDSEDSYYSDGFCFRTPERMAFDSRSNTGGQWRAPDGKVYDCEKTFVLAWRVTIDLYDKKTPDKFGAYVVIEDRNPAVLFLNVSEGKHILKPVDEARWFLQHKDSIPTLELWREYHAWCDAEYKKLHPATA
jgi:hypothetical protein